MDQKINESSIIGYREYFIKLWKESKPLARLFHTSRQRYVYDTGTNKIFKCSDLEFELLEGLLSIDISGAIDSFISRYGSSRFLYTAENIKNAIQNENILLTKPANQFGLSDHYCRLKELVDTSLGILNLEVTENCNLRCDYCIYSPQYKSKRTHGTKKMSLSIAQLAIRYLKNHSSRSESVYIGYYGGEPLLEFELIESSATYAKNLFKEEKIGFSLTTNATLITRRISEFLFKNNFRILVSLDGPEEIHNSYRKDIHGNGSFQKTIGGLKNLIDVFDEDAHKRIMLNMVYTPLFSEQKLERISQLWDELPWLPRYIKARFTYPTPGSIPEERLPKENVWEDKSLLQWSYEKYLDQYFKGGNSNPIAEIQLDTNLASLVQRPIYDKPLDKYYLNGCCIPAVRRLFVSATGNFHVCERISTDAPTIGNVYTGIDIKKIQRFYVEEYERLSLQVCRYCWALQLCNACYVHALKSGCLDLDAKKHFCSILLPSREFFLKIYCELLERKKDSLNFLSQYKIW